MQIVPAGLNSPLFARPQQALPGPAAHEPPAPTRLATTAELTGWATSEPVRAREELERLLQNPAGFERLPGLLTAARQDEPLRRLLEPFHERIWSTGNMDLNRRLLEDRHKPDAGFEQRELWPRLSAGAKGATEALRSFWAASGYRERSARFSPLFKLDQPVGKEVGALLQSEFPLTNSSSYRPNPELRAHLEGRVEQSLARLANQPLGRPNLDSELEAHRQQLLALTPFVEDKSLAGRLLDTVLADSSVALYSEPGKSSGLAQSVYQLVFPDSDKLQGLLGEFQTELKATGSLAGLSDRGQRLFGLLVAQAEDQQFMSSFGAALEDEFRRPHKGTEEGPLVRLLVLTASACNSDLSGNWQLEQTFPRLRHTVELLVEAKLAHADSKWHHLENGWASGLTEAIEKHLWHGIYGQQPVPTVAPVEDGALSLNLKAARKHVAEMLEQLADGPANPKSGAALQILEHFSRRDSVLADRLTSDSKTLLHDWSSVPVEGVRQAASRLRHRLLDRNLSRLPLERDAVREETLKVAASLGDAQLVATLPAFYPALSPIAVRLKEPPDVLALYREIQSRGPESTINQRLEWAERLLGLVQAQGSEHLAEDTLRGYQRLEDLLASGQTFSQAMDTVAHELFNLNGLLGGSADYERAPATIQEQASHLTIGGSRIKKRQDSAALG